MSNDGKPVTPGSESGAPAFDPDTPLPPKGNALDSFRSRVARRPRKTTPYPGRYVSTERGPESS